MYFAPFADVFKFDTEYELNENKYKGLSKELLGSDASGSEDDGSSSDGSGSDDDEAAEGGAGEQEKKDLIIDQTETNLVALRRTIYLTIHSSLDYEECAHKLMKMELKPGQEMELCHMFLDCCAEQRTYEKFYGLLAQRFCNINKIYIPPFEEIFKDTYATTHRLDTNRLRNVSKFFAHLLFTDAIGWDVMECIRLNEDDTTSSSRIFIKILFQELAEYMGLGKLNARLKDVTIQESFSGLFPRDNPRNTRFAINFFTSIGLGGLTDELREHLKNVPKLMPPPVASEVPTINEDGSSSSSDSSSSSSSSSSSDSSSESSSSSASSSDSSVSVKKSKKKKKSSARSVVKSSKKSDQRQSKRSDSKRSRSKDKPKKREETKVSRHAPRRDSRERDYGTQDDRRRVDKESPSPQRRRRTDRDSKSPQRRRRTDRDSTSPQRRRRVDRESTSPQQRRRRRRSDEDSSERKQQRDSKRSRKDDRRETKSKRSISSESD